MPEEPPPELRRVPPSPALPMADDGGALARVIAVNHRRPAIPPHAAPPGPLRRPSLPHVAMRPLCGVRRASARERSQQPPLFSCAIPSGPTHQSPPDTVPHLKVKFSRNVCKPAPQDQVQEVVRDQKTQIQDQVQDLVQDLGLHQILHKN